MNDLVPCPPSNCRRVFDESVELYATEAGVYLRPSAPYAPMTIEVSPELLAWLDGDTRSPIRPDGSALGVVIMALAFARSQEEQTTQVFLGTAVQIEHLARAFDRFGSRVAALEHYPGYDNTFCIFRCPASHDSDLLWHVFYLVLRGADEAAGLCTWHLDTA